MRAVTKAFASAVGFACLAALPAQADDLTIVSTVRAKDHTATATQYLSSDKARSSNGDTDTIMNYATGTMTMIDNRKKEYYETSAAEMAAMFDQFRQMGANSPLGGLMGGKVSDVSVQKVEGAKKVAGYDCDHYILSMGDDMKFDIWAAPDLKAPQQYYDASKAPYAAMGPMGARFEKMFEAMKKIKGFPLSTGINAKVMMLKIDTLSEATEVNTGSIPASAFDIPAGYKKKDSPFNKRR
jgi:hypothetical protein